MQVSSAGEDYSLPGSQSRVAAKSLDRDAFLRLLVEQLRNQDPMKPQDSSEFIAQLATFSSLEQLTNLNNEVQQMKHCQDMMQASALIGKRVEIKTSDGAVSGTVEKVLVGADNVKVFMNGNQYDINSISLIEADESAAAIETNHNAPGTTG